MKSVGEMIELLAWHERYHAYFSKHVNAENETIRRIAKERVFNHGEQIYVLKNRIERRSKSES